MTIENITTQLDRISADSWYFVDDNDIELTINDIEMCDDDEAWCEVDRELENEDAVYDVLEWLKENADYVDGDFYCYYHFGDIIVELGWASFDI